MQRSPVLWRSLVILSVILGIAYAVSASGQTKNPTITFATVDFNQVASNFTEKQDADAELQTLQNTYQQRLARRDSMPLLSEAEQEQLDALSEKPNPTTADKTQINQLTQKGLQLSQTLQQLRQKKDSDLTATEKTQLNQLENMIPQAQQTYAQLRSQYAKELQQKEQQVTQKIVTDIRAAVEKVAKKQNISVVFSSDVALYAGTDITNAVIAQANKDYKK